MPGPHRRSSPSSPDDPIDLLFIDGCHAHPFPQLDWYLAAPRVRSGGIVIVDDIQLPGPASLHRFLRRDEHWGLLIDAGFWSAFRRRAAFDSTTEWASQTHPVDGLDRMRHLARTPRRLAALARNARYAQRLGVAPWQRGGRPRRLTRHRGPGTGSFRQTGTMSSCRYPGVGVRNGA